MRPTSVVPALRQSRRDAGSVSVAFDGPIVTVTIGTGRRRNALNGDAWKDLALKIIGISTHASLGVVVLRGVGDTFCSGSDVTEWVSARAEDVEESFAQMEAAFRAIEACPVPVIAQISGVAAGAGCQLALSCDIRVMATSARIGMPIARLGIRPSPAFAARLVRVVGPAVAGELHYTGRLLQGSDAVTTGLANRCVTDELLASSVRELVEEIGRQPTSAVRAAKEALIAATGSAPRHALGPAVNLRELQLGIAQILHT